ncbi:MAG TPA: aldose 1-epimerase family protein [Gaiellaceae bacterium]|nr:aldose 1-epimerase family protein [Gaiellaceae bacterium]
MRAPSGEQIELVAGGQRVVVVEVGGGIRSYAVDGRALLDGYGAGEMCTSGRGQVLIPWPNRLRGGSYEFDGRRHQFALSEPAQGNAIHGLVRWSAWKVGERRGDRVAMEHVVHPQPGYPFRLELRIEYELSSSGLSVRTTAANTGAEACPYGCGAHPYLSVATAGVDSVILRAPADRVIFSDEQGIPNGDAVVDGTAYDFRSPRLVGDTRLDNAFTELERDADGLARIELRDATSGAGADVWMDETYRYVMLFSGDPLPDVNRRSLAVEPMTCPPNAFRSGEAVVRLEPGASCTSAWGIAPVSP